MGHNLFYCFLRGKIALCWDTNVLISQLPGQTSPAHIPFNLLRNGVSYSSDLEFLCFLELSMMMIVEICWMGSNQHLAFSQPMICIWDGNLKETSLTWDSEWKENPSKDPRFWDLIKCSKEEWSNWWLWLFHFLDACVNYHPTSRKNPFHTR